MSSVEGILSGPRTPLRGPSASCLQDYPEARGRARGLGRRGGEGPR